MQKRLLQSTLINKILISMNKAAEPIDRVRLFYLPSEAGIASILPDLYSNVRVEMLWVLLYWLIRIRVSKER